MIQHRKQSNLIFLSLPYLPQNKHRVLYRRNAIYFSIQYNDGYPTLSAKLFDGQITWLPQVFVDRMQSGFNLWILPVASCNLLTSCFVIFLLLLLLLPCFFLQNVQRQRKTERQRFPRWCQKDIFMCFFLLCYIPYMSILAQNCALFPAAFLCQLSESYCNIFKLQTFVILACFHFKLFINFWYNC